MQAKLTKYPTGWTRINNIFVFDYDWQKPAKTELDAFETIVEKDKSDIFTQYICFPWASLTDYLRQGKLKKAEKLITGLKFSPPKFSLRITTFCQHIYALDLLPYFKKLGITDIYWSHKVKHQDQIEGIKLHPYSLYPVMHFRRSAPSMNKPIEERKYLYSFIGSYQADLYLTEVRRWIFNLPKRKDAYIKERKEWHFEQEVYRTQMSGIAESEAASLIRKQHEIEYIEVMEETVFCLCPSGSGPNSIRIWEALKFGCIPVILSDTLDFDIDKSKILQVEESQESVLNLPALLESKMKKN